MLHTEAFLSTLPVMAKGMGGIFLVTAAIILCIALLNGASGLRQKKQGADKDA